jgi:proteasome lid subunit RPN8/RPN11
MPIQITPEHDAAIRAHAAKDYPHECCGFLVGKSLVGTSGSGTVTVAHAIPAANQRDDSPRNRFEIDPGDLVKADRAARAEGLGVVGFYHSHPDAPAMPSEFDREHAWPGYCYVIVSVRAGQTAEMRNWLLRDDRVRFEEDAILPTEDELTEETI